MPASAPILSMPAAPAFLEPLAPMGAPPRAVPRLRLVLLGRVEAWGPSGISLLPRTRKARALLAILGLAAGTPVLRTQLADLLWSRGGPDQRRGSLRQALHELHGALEPAGMPLLEATREQVRLRPGEVWVDAVEAAHGTQPQTASLDLLGSELMADLDHLDPALDSWLASQRRLLRDATARLASRLLDDAHTSDSKVDIARRALAADPGNEAAWRALMRAEAARGNRGAALAAYEGCRAGLQARFGTVPNAETDSLVQALRDEGQVAVAIRPTPAPVPSAPPRMRGARLGVAPLRVFGGADAAHLSAGLAEEVTAALSRFRWVYVVDSASLAQAAAEQGDLAAAEASNLDLLLSGSVQRSGDQIRLLLRLTDLREPRSVAWSGRFERRAEDLMALQEEVAAEVVGRIDPEILLIEAGRAARTTVGASAYDLLLRAIPALHRLDRAGFQAAGEWLSAATAQEPDFAAAHAWQAYWRLLLIGQGWAEDEAAAMAAAEQDARRATALDPLDAVGLTILGHVLAFLHHRAAEALALHERALALNPNLAMAWVFAGFAECYLGRHEAALTRFDRYARLAPQHPHAFFFDAARALPLFCLGRFRDAAEICRQATALNDALSYPWKLLLSSLGHLGAEAECAEVRRRLLAIEPQFDVEDALRRTPLRRSEDRESYAEGLRRAGLP